MRGWIATVAGVIGIAVAAGGSFAAPKAQPTCTPEGTALTISADDSEYNKDCLVAPANEPFTITFDNQEDYPHNVAIYDVNDGDKVLFKGEVFNGPKTVTYSVPAQTEGTYEFRCDPHDGLMRGVFVVGNGGPTTTTTSPTTTTTSAPGPTLPLP